MLAPGYVREDRGKLAAFRAEGSHLKVFVHGAQIMLKSSGLAGEGDLAVDIDPILLHLREDFSHCLADRLTARDAQDLLKRRVNI